MEGGNFRLEAGHYFLPQAFLLFIHRPADSIAAWASRSRGRLCQLPELHLRVSLIFLSHSTCPHFIALVVAVVAPRSGPCREPIIHEKMADQLVEQLKATVDKLENRVNELETRLHGGSVAVKPGEGQGMRMILIGPPGAGMWRSH